MGFFSNIVKGIGKVAAPVLKIGSTVAAVTGKEKAAQVLGDLGDIATGERLRTDTLDLNNQAMSFQREMNEAQQKFNSAEAEKTRAFNSEEAAKQRQFVEQMYEQQTKDNREWNDIGAQLQRQMAAGLNPLSMDSETMSLGNPGTGVAANGGSPASFHPNGAPALANPSIGIANQMADLRLKNAQIEAAEDENSRKNELHPYEIETAKGNIIFVATNVKLNEAKTRELEAQIPLIQSQMQKTSEEIAGIALDNEFKKKDLKVWEERYNREVKRWELENDVIIANKAEIYQRISNLMSQKNLIDEQVTAQQYRNYLDGFEVKIRKDNEEAIIKYMWDIDKARYDLVLEELGEQKRISEWRNSDKWYWQPLVKQLDFLNMLSESIGMSISASSSQSSSRSVSSSTSSNVSDIFTHKVE